MKLSRSFAILAVAALFATPLAAQNMKLTGVNGAWATYATNSGSESVYIGAYYGQMLPGGPHVDLYCDDFAHSVSIGQTWTAHFTDFTAMTTSAGLGQTRWGAAGASLTDYEKAAWLVLQFNTHSTSQWAGIHDALWNIFTPQNPHLTSSGSYWYTQAQQYWNDGSVKLGEWTVVTDNNFQTKAGGVQEFLMHRTVTPEPATLILLGTGLALTLMVGVTTKRIA
jgi:hypothetical protein